MPPPMSPEIERERESTYIEERERERRVEGDDVVEVIEEHSESTDHPKRKKSSGYRPVDPNAYAGGNYEQREVDRRRRR